MNSEARDFRAPPSRPLWWCVVDPPLPEPVMVWHKFWHEARALAEVELARRGIGELGRKPVLVYWDEDTQEWK